MSRNDLDVDIGPTTRRAQAAYNAGGKGARLTVTLSPVAAEMLRKLHETGLYGLAGHGVAGVAQTFIYEKLREYIKESR